MTPRQIRVLHIVNDLNHGGLERVVADIARRTDASRFETHVLALQFMGHFGEGLDAFATLHVADPMRRLSMVYPRALTHQLRSIAPDVVHLHSGVWYKASAAASLAGVPLKIYTDHGRQHPDPWINRAVDRRASRHTDVVVAVSSDLKNTLAKFVYFPSRLRVIRNGVDTDRYTPQSDDHDFRRELGIGLNTPIIGSTGRLEPVKGYDVLISAFARLLGSWTESPKPVLVLVGDGSARGDLERDARALGIADSVHFAGWRRDIERMTRAFTIFSMSSHSEGTSMSLLETMSTGVCPVVTDVGGNATILGPDLSHRLVVPADPNALAAALSRALLDHPSRDRDAVIARRRVVQDFGLDAMVHSYESLYSTAIDTHRSAQ